MSSSAFSPIVFSFGLKCVLLPLFSAKLSDLGPGLSCHILSEIWCDWSDSRSLNIGNISKFTDYKLNRPIACLIDL